MTQCLSIDHVIFEKFKTEDGIEYVAITRFDRSGDKMSPVEIKVGDEAKGIEFLNQIAGLLGISPVFKNEH